MENIIAIAQNAPQNLLVVFLILVVLTIFATFLLPIFLKSEKLRFNTSYLFKKIKENKAVALVVLGVIVAIFVGAFYWYLTTRPIVISAENFNRREAKSLEYIDSNIIYDIVTEGDLMLIDARSEKVFFKSHVTKSFNVPPDGLEQNRVLLQVKGKKAAVFAGESEFKRAMQVAVYIKGNVTDKKVYVIKDGYEGMKEVGFTLEKGDQYESEPIKK